MLRQLGRTARFHAEQLLAPPSQTQDRLGLRQNENCCHFAAPQLYRYLVGYDPRFGGKPAPWGDPNQRPAIAGDPVLVEPVARCFLEYRGNKKRRIRDHLDFLRVSACAVRRASGSHAVTHSIQVGECQPGKESARRGIQRPNAQ
jgi:hypothetical protein